MGPILCPEKSAKYYHSTLPNITEERRSEGTRPLGKPRYKWENNIEIDFEYMRCVCGGAYLGLEYGPLDTVMNILVFTVWGKFWTS
jgi:hypothetical protein